MTPSAALKELLSTGSETGWHLHERRIALRLIGTEGSSDLLDSVRREMKFIQDEQILPAGNVSGIMRSVQRDPGSSGEPAFSHEASGCWDILRKPKTL